MPRPARLPITDDGQLALRDLEAEIRLVEGRGETEELIPRLGQRAMILGRIDDRERALQLAESWAARMPRAPAALAARAEARAALHHFAAALEDLDRARTLGPPAPAATATRAAILLATGRAAEALALRQEAARLHPDVLALGGLGVALAEMGRTEEAEASYVAAIAAHRNPAPFPVAWIELQRGLLWEAEGQMARARDHYAEAMARLPAYAPALGHLAGVLAALGDKAQAVELLGRVVATSDDPEYVAQLADLQGDAALRAKARQRYEELLARQPRAFAAAAARFYLGAGRDPARAAHWAKQDLAERKTAQAYALLAEAELATGRAGEACEAAAAGLALTTARKGDLAVYWRAFSACGDAGRAAQVDARLRPPAGGR